MIHPPFSNDDESTSSLKKSFSRRSKDVDQSYKRPLAVGGSLVLTGGGSYLKDVWYGLGDLSGIQLDGLVNLEF